jgi:SAM-dependent methyltransferase
MPTTDEATTAATGFRVERLQRLGHFFVDTAFKTGDRGPRTLEINGERHWRFMDFFYLPRPAARLDQESVVELCEIRRQFAAECIDLHHNSAVATRLSALLAPGLPNEAHILDFGCGDGLSMKLIQDTTTLPVGTRVSGVDLSNTAIAAARDAGFSAYLATLPFPFGDAVFDGAYALFVMHFDVGRDYLAELARVLKPGAAFCFNIYNAPSDRCRRRLLEAGFEHPQKGNTLRASRNHDFYRYRKPMSFDRTSRPGPKG